MNFQGEHWDIAEETMEEYDPDPDHARQVTRLALQIFDQLQPFIDMLDLSSEPASDTQNGLTSRNILKTAAMLHDIGWSAPGSRGHHKKSRDMILGIDFRNLSVTDHNLVAQVARYHRKNHPDPTVHPDFDALDETAQERVRWLAAILRIADGMDRSHQSEADEVTCTVSDSSIRITIECNPQSRSSVQYGASLKKGLLEEVSGLPVEFATINCLPAN